MFCRLCHKHFFAAAAGPAVCPECFQRWKRFEGRELKTSFRQSMLFAIYSYEDDVRALIHRAKIRGDYQALRLIITLWQNHPLTRWLVAWCDAICPAPSSLWGRLHGRYDIAGLFAMELKRLRPVIKLPTHYWWRWQKRARLRSRGKRGQPLRYWNEGRNIDVDKSLSKGRLLIVDDIVTTGFTMAEIARHFDGYHLRFLAFARAGLSTGEEYGSQGGSGNGIVNADDAAVL